MSLPVLKNLRILEIKGLGPGPFAVMTLADLPGRFCRSSNARPDGCW